MHISTVLIHSLNNQVPLTRDVQLYQKNTKQWLNIGLHGTKGLKSFSTSCHQASVVTLHKYEILKVLDSLIMFKLREGWMTVQVKRVLTHLSNVCPTTITLHKKLKMKYYNNNNNYYSYYWNNIFHPWSPSFEAEEHVWFDMPQNNLNHEKLFTRLLLGHFGDLRACGRFPFISHFTPGISNYLKN